MIIFLYLLVLLDALSAGLLTALLLTVLGSTAQVLRTATASSRRSRRFWLRQMLTFLVALAALPLPGAFIVFLLTPSAAYGTALLLESACAWTPLTMIVILVAYIRLYRYWRHYLLAVALLSVLAIGIQVGAIVLRGQPTYKVGCTGPPPPGGLASLEMRQGDTLEVSASRIGCNYGIEGPQILTLIPAGLIPAGARDRYYAIQPGMTQLIIRCGDLGPGSPDWVCPVPIHVRNP
jgi:hypothetical protein